MKKILIGFLFLVVLFSTINAFALIVTDNVDRDKFQYRSNYEFATTDIAASQTRVFMPTAPGQGSNAVNQLVVRRAYSATYNAAALEARIVGIAISGNAACTAGSATFDVVINGTTTGVQAVIEASPVRKPVGTYGASATQYAYTIADRSSDYTPQGFQMAVSAPYWHSGAYPWGRTTPLSAGDRIGVKITTSSDFAPTTTDYVSEVYVLE